MKKYSYYISIEGLNFHRLFESFVKQEIKIYNLKRPNYKTAMFGMNYFDFLKAQKLKLFIPYKMQIYKRHNLAYVLNNLFKNCGLYVGAIISAIVLFFISSMTLKIDILGLEQISSQEVIELLDEINVKSGKINKVSNEDIEQHLKKSSDKISLVSVINKGTNIIINIKEKDIIDETAYPLFSPYNLIVKNVELSQGEARVKKDDVVKKGDVLIEPQLILSNKEEVFLPPIAKIYGTAWITGSVQFKTEETIYKKTGKKIIHSYYEMFNNKFFINEPRVKFEHYEEKRYNNYVSKNMFLPIKLNKIVYYETKAETNTYNFEENREKLIKQSKAMAYKNLPDGKAVNAEETFVSINGNTIDVVTYLHIDVVIEG